MHSKTAMFILALSYIAFTLGSELSVSQVCSQSCVIAGFAGTCYSNCPPCYTQNGNTWSCFDYAAGTNNCPWGGMTDCGSQNNQGNQNNQGSQNNQGNQNNQGIQWNPSSNFAWAQGCDWVGNDMSSAQTAASDCGGTCVNTPGCTHMAWTPPSNCWLKTNSVQESDAIASSTNGIVCGLILGGSPPPPTSNPNPPSGGNGACPKRGIAYTFPDQNDMAAVGNKISWWYNWGAQPAGAEQNHGNYGIEFVPMIWGQNFINSQIPQGSQFVLGFNEPNFMVQANLQPGQAASLWGQVTNAIRGAGNGGNYRVVSPALNYCGPAGSCIDTDPFVWLDQFFSACQGCQVDMIAAHWYGCTADALTNYLSSLKKYGKKIWITEFACAQWDSSWQNSEDFQIQYMKAAVSILENDPMVFRYSWFTGRTSDIPLVNLFAGTGQLTDLGNQYFSQPCGAGVSMAVDDATAQNAAVLGSNQSSSPSPLSPLVIGLSIGGAILLIVIVALLIVFVPRGGKTVESV